MEYIQGTDRRQEILFPEIIDDYIEESNPVRFIEAFVNSLNLKELGFKHAELNSTGRPPYNPVDLLKLYIYGYLNRIRSSRLLEKECRRNVEVMWLLKKLAPDFKTIADFRKDNRDAIKRVFKEFVFLCKKLDLFGGVLVAIDGSKFKAVNSKKRNFNDAKLKKKLKDIEEKIEQYFEEIEENDNSESHDRSPDKEELKGKIELLTERKEEYQELSKKLKESGKTQISLTDPDSRAMLNNQKIEVCYNVQIAVDEKNKLVLDYEVTNAVEDSDQLSEMSKRAKNILEVEELKVTADSGYYNPEEIKECLDNGIIPYVPERNADGGKSIDPSFYKRKFTYDKDKDVYVCPAGNVLKLWATYNARMEKLYKTEKCSSCELRLKCTSHKRGRIVTRRRYEEILEENRKRVKENTDMINKRKELVEHPFGTIKRAFNQSYLLLKRFPKVGAEMSLTMLAYDITRAINIVGLKKLIAEVTTV